MANEMQWIGKGKDLTQYTLMDKRMPKFAANATNRFANIGASGFGRSAISGALSGFGIGGKAGARTFLGTPMAQVGGWKIASALGSFGFGYAAYAATGNPLMGIGMGLAASGATKAGLGSMTGLGFAFTASSIMQGFREGGVFGAVKEGVSSTIQMAAFDVGLKALGAATGITGGAAMAIGIPLAAIAGAGYMAFKGAEYFAARGRKSYKTEFSGDLSAFNTQAAYTMRERSMQSLQTSHGSAMAALGPARSILGNEASLMHF